jgi:hypothetical protein
MHDEDYCTKNDATDIISIANVLVDEISNTAISSNTINKIIFWMVV